MQNKDIASISSILVIACWLSSDGSSLALMNACSKVWVGALQ